jgi:hypothetical protein
MTHRTPRNQLAGAALLLAALMPFVGCSDDDDGAGASTSAATAPAETTTRPAAPTSTSTTARTTEGPTTTLAPPTTVDPIAATKAAVAAAAVQSRLDYLYAVQNYDAPDAMAVLSSHVAANSPALQLGIQNMETLRSHGWRVRPNPDVPSSLTVESDVTLLDGPPATKAELTVCEVSAGIVYEPSSGPNGEDTIVNDEINSSRSRITMVLEDGAWKLVSGEDLGTFDGQSSCPPV